jgi:predicted kinase
MTQVHAPDPRLVLVTGWTGAGKSTIANAIAAELGATVASFDWLMSGLRAFPEIWKAIETPAERQREVGWSLLSRVAEQQLRRGSSCVLDLVAREAPRARWQELATSLGATFHVVECVCSDLEIHKSLLEGRNRAIPGWYELDWADALRVRENYVPLEEPKLVLDAVDPLSSNVAKARALLGIADP